MKKLRSFLFFLFIASLFFSLIKNIFDFRKTLNFYDGYKNAYEKEQKKNITLQTQILKNRDPYEIEKIIRNKLNLARPDEISLILPTPSPFPKKPPPAPVPIYLQWWNIFAGI